MNRVARAAACTFAALVFTACELPLSEPDSRGMAELRVTAVVDGTPINTLVVEVTAADIATPLVFNLTVENGVAQGTIRVPPGPARTITVRAYDSDGSITDEGSKTIDVKRGQNPPVSIPMVPRAGQLPITVTVGPVSVVVRPGSGSILVGGVLRLSVSITAANGDPLAGPAEWATTTPAVATVDQTGMVTGVMPGEADIVATFAGVAGVAHVTVFASAIAFTSNRDGNYEIYVMNPDGTGAVNLTNNAADDLNPAWSFDGFRIAFTSNRDGNFEVYVMSEDGTGAVNLTNNAADDFNPTWSPDGRKIAFASGRDDPVNDEIYVMNADGTGVVRLTNNAAGDFGPVWSPDGTKIAFVSDRDDPNGEIYLMNADGTGVVRLTNDPGSDFAPAWSPDGTKIAFTSDRAGNMDVYTMNADGTALTKLTDNPSVDWFPAWSPDGAKIAFASSRDHNQEVYVMNADGTNQTRLTNNPAADSHPQWRPSVRQPGP